MGGVLAGSVKGRKARSKRGSKSLTNIAQKHITRRIGAHQRAALRRKEARKRGRRRG